MLHRIFPGTLLFALLATGVLHAQVKEMPRTPVKVINEQRVVDINTAPEADIVAIGIDRPAAKKIVDGRPYRNKRELITKQLLTKEQYEKFKNSLVAKRTKKS